MKVLMKESYCITMNIHLKPYNEILAFINDSLQNINYFKENFKENYHINEINSLSSLNVVQEIGHRTQLKRIQLNNSIFCKK